MAHSGATSGRRKRTPKPLDAARLEELALSYVARFATTAGKLEGYLRRKLRERGWDDDAEPPVAQLVERFIAKNYVDDEAYGRAKTQGLLARGYGPRRIEQALRAADVDEEVRIDLAPGEYARRQSVVALARRRGFGPFGVPLPDSADAAHKLREKRLAAMVRAGHDFDAARHVLDAANVDELETWVAEAWEED